MSKDSQSFIYDNDQITGAVYGLYADEDIKKDDGAVVWKKDELIDQKTTTKDKEIYLQEEMRIKKKPEIFILKVLCQRDQGSSRLHQRSGKT